MVRIRLTRKGKRHQPFYRIVVADARAPRDGEYIESIGYYNPLRKEEFSLDLEKFGAWVNKGAQPTNTVLRLVKRAKKEEGSHEHEGDN